jgi:L-ascorbate metabolism protein UlaG (beta-lactamase superfamily)
MKITWFGHSAFRLEFGSSVVLVDPFLTGNPIFKGDVAAATAGATHVLLTHGHADHVGDTVEICQRTGAKLVTNYDLAMYLARTGGLTKLDPMNSGGETDQGEFTVAMTIAFHSSAEIDANGVSQSLGHPTGLVISPKDSKEPVVYHAGDTAVFSDMALIDEFYRPKVAILPIGDRFTMGPKHAALAVKRFLPSVEVAIPCHYATFGLLLPDANGFVEAMAGAKARVLVPDSGTPFSL